jgi:lysophospholipase L1-like esterase
VTVLKKILKKLIFSLLAAALVLLLSEGALRAVAGLTEKDWRTDPLPAHAEYEVLCEFSDLLRMCPDQGPEYERVRPEVFFPTADRPRVVVIGESSVYGLGIAATEAWPARLEAHLGGAAEVLNMGRCGTYASRLVPIVQAALTIEPSAIVLAIGNNEHTMTSFYTGLAARDPLAVYAMSRTLGRIQLYGLLSRVLIGDGRVVESFEAPRELLSDPVERLAYAARRRPPDLTAFPDALASPEVTALIEREQRLKERIYREHMIAMLDAIAPTGVPVVLATMARDLTVPPVLSGVHIPENADRIRALLHRLENHRSEQVAIVAEGLALDERVSAFQYENAMILRRQGRLAEAAEGARTAVEWDLVPDGTPAINTIIRQLAAERGLALLDLDVLADASLSDPEALFLDKVHFNARGADRVGEEAAGVLHGVLGLPGAGPVR